MQCHYAVITFSLYYTVLLYSVTKQCTHIHYSIIIQCTQCHTLWHTYCHYSVYTALLYTVTQCYYTVSLYIKCTQYTQCHYMVYMASLYGEHNSPYGERHCVHCMMALSALYSDSSDYLVTLYIIIFIVKMRTLYSDTVHIL